MSSAAPDNARVSPLAPARQLVERARLAAVPRLRPARSSAPRVPFIVLVSLLLVGGVVGLLMFNTSMQNAAFSEASLQQQADDLAAREQTLEQQLQTMNDPQRIAEKAQSLGMVIPNSPAWLSVPSGKVKGTPTPANGDATPPLWSANPRPYVAPSTPSTTSKTTTTKSTKTTKTPTAKTGAPSGKQAEQGTKSTAGSRTKGSAHHG